MRDASADRLKRQRWTGQRGGDEKKRHESVFLAKSPRIVPGAVLMFREQFFKDIQNVLS